MSRPRSRYWTPESRSRLRLRFSSSRSAALANRPSSTIAGTATLMCRSAGAGTCRYGRLGKPVWPPRRMKGWLPGQTLAPTIDGLTGIGRVEQQGVDHGTAPVPATGWAGDAIAEQAPADPSERRALVPNPGEDLAHNPGCVLLDLIPGGPSARLPRDVAIAERRAGEDADGTRLGPVALPAPTALEHLGPLVFGEHALELEQQAVLRRVSDRAIEEDDLRTGAGELLQQQHLMRVAAGEAIRGVDVDDINRRQGHEVTQT